MGKQLPGGDDCKLRWILGAVEDITLSGPYALIMAGGSLHWFDHNVVMPLFASLLTEQGFLAVVERECSVGLNDSDIISKYSANQDYEPFHLLNALEDAGLFRKVGGSRDRDTGLDANRE